MADNIDTGDDSLNNLPAAEREKVGEVTTPRTNKREDLTQIQDSDNMEVHHHSHSHGNKNWRTYAWEFGMLFLAVFCSFLAEYFLEHRIEKERGRQYVQSMIEDIASDSIKISERLMKTKKQALGLDSLSLLISNPPYNDSTIKHIYVLMLKYTEVIYDVDFTKRTISQLRNSGGLRLIPNKTSADEITRYSELVEKAEIQHENYAKNGIYEILKLNNKIFEIRFRRGLSIDNLFTKTHTVKLANNDENLLMEYANLTYSTSMVLTNYNIKLADLQAQIPKTIAILKEANHME
jgi:hypothetical protein